jgi:hypothetical protein
MAVSSLKVVLFAVAEVSWACSSQSITQNTGGKSLSCIFFQIHPNPLPLPPLSQP